MVRERFFASTERSSGGRDWRRAHPPLLLSGEWSLLELRFFVVISQALDAVQRKLEHEPAEDSLRVAARGSEADNRASARRQSSSPRFASNHCQGSWTS